MAITQAAITSGGRSLSCIWATPNLSANEKLVLQYLGSQVNFSIGDFTARRWTPIARIVAATSLSRRTVFTVIKKLETKGYLTREQRFENHCQLPNSYSLTSKVFFKEYSDVLQMKRGKVSAEVSYNAARSSIPVQTLHPVSEAETLNLVNPLHTNSFNRSPSRTPSFLSKKDGDTQYQMQLREARRLVAAVFMPSESPNSPTRFVDRNSLDQRMEDALQRFGIEVIRKFKQEIETKGCLGRVMYCPNRLFDYLRATQAADVEAAVN